MKEVSLDIFKSRDMLFSPIRTQYILWHICIFAFYCAARYIWTSLRSYCIQICMLNFNDLWRIKIWEKIVWKSFKKSFKKSSKSVQYNTVSRYWKCGKAVRKQRHKITQHLELYVTSEENWYRIVTLNKAMLLFGTVRLRRHQKHSHHILFNSFIHMRASLFGFG